MDKTVIKIMETLFTAFLSTATNDVVSAESYEEDLGSKLVTPMDNSVFERTKTGEDLIYSPLDFVTSCGIELLKKPTYKKIPFLEYFKHQLFHISLQQRMHGVVNFESKCCLKLGKCVKSYHSKMKSHICCCNMNMLDSEKNNKNSLDCKIPCACEQPKTIDSLCNKHNLFIKDMEYRKGSSAWSVSFIDNAIMSCEIPEQSDIELDFFVDDIDSVYVDSSMHHLSFSLSEDWDDEEDTESVAYESSDDDDDNGIICFETCVDAILSSFHCMSDAKSLDMTPKELYNREQAPSRMKKVSTYHKKCCIKKNENIKIDQNKRTVRFVDDSELVTVHHIVAWNYAYRQSRKSSWAETAANRAHFKRRIDIASKLLEPLLWNKINIINNTKCEESLNGA